jgi:hypothetical protein
LDNIDKYRYILVKDTDEIVFPYQNDAINYESAYFRRFLNETSHCENFTQLASLMAASPSLFSVNFAEVQEINIEQTIEQVVSLQMKQHNYPTSMYYQYEYFLDNQYIDSFCDSLFDSLNKSQLRLAVFVRKTYFPRRYTRFRNRHRNRDLIIRLENKTDLLYAVYMCEFNKRHVRPFVSLIEQQYANGSQYPSEFTRFFSVHLRYGKSVTDSGKGMSLFQHFAKQEYRFHKNETKFVQSYVYRTGKSGATCHFRKNQTTYLTARFYDIKKFKLDLSYLKIYSKINNRLLTFA